MFSTLYALIYVLMRQEDYALLVGSIASFLAIAGTMWMTRKLDWYGVGRTPAPQPCRRARPKWLGRLPVAASPSGEERQSATIDGAARSARIRHRPMALTPFHIAFPVNDLKAARHFYGSVLGCPEGRSSDEWIDFDLYGHQIVAHLKPGPGGRRGASQSGGRPRCAGAAFRRGADGWSSGARWPSG